MKRPDPALRVLILGLWLWAVGGGAAAAVELVLKDGRILRGKLGLLPGMGEMPRAASADGPAPKLIAMLDDDLRRTFVPIFWIKEQRQQENAEVLEKFRLPQQVSESGPMVKSVGPFMKVEPFSEFGRRRVKMNAIPKPIDVVQGITELTPEWARVQGTRAQGASYVWDMRIATSSIPQDQLAKILAKLAEDGGSDQRRKIARFYVQAGRFAEAADEVQAVLAAAPGDAELRKQLEAVLKDILQAHAKQLFAELSFRREAGQHRLVQEALKKFPEKGAAAETLQAVREMVEEYGKLEAACKGVLGQFDALLGKINDQALQKQLAPIRAELGAELNYSALSRMAAFREMADDAGIPPQDKLALAISGWLLDSAGATTQLSTALSLVRMRDLIRKYVAAPQQVARSEILRAFGSEEGANPALVARLLANMKPPVDTPPPEGGPSQPYELEVPGQANAPPVRYFVQLPPEYDPHRRYPAVVSLYGAGMSPQQQIDWWAGPVVKGGWRAGQASRHGYIVVAPAWAAEHQKRYLFSAREHAAVLDSLRDACRRFSIDVDRVFLSGHSTGGDAAWDIGLAHPDLWAGVIPIVARSERYSVYYWENAALVPLYFVAGELDGDRMANNARDWDRYMIRRYNVTVVEYRGRGHDGFSDEILRLFDWMGRYRRNFFPKDFKAISMRPWDNFFWWVELDRLPPQAMTDPSQWESRRNRPRVTLDASATRTNAIRVQTGAGRVTVWLSPDLLDLGRRVTLTINGRRVGSNQSTVVPDLATMLEDVRTRGDRQHPFWAKIEWPGGPAAKGQ